VPGLEMKDIVVIGGGGHAKVVISILRKLNQFRVLGYTDRKDNGALLEVPYLGDDSELTELTISRRTLGAVIGVGQLGLGQARCKLWERVSAAGLSFPVIISPSAIVNEGVELAEAAVVMDRAVINSGAVVGTGSIVNTGAIVEHDTVLSDWVHIAPGATISGGTRIGSRCTVGAGAVVIEGKTIAGDCIIGAGAVVTRDIVEAGVYVGCPARRIR
jgi:sugar O-acyltransferase (sialic acid O-acetyltransferase NeuD family)